MGRILRIVFPEEENGGCFWNFCENKELMGFYSEKNNIIARKREPFQQTKRNVAHTGNMILLKLAEAKKKAGEQTGIVKTKDLADELFCTEATIHNNISLIRQIDPVLEKYIHSDNGYWLDQDVKIEELEEYIPEYAQVTEGEANLVGTGHQNTDSELHTAILYAIVDHDVIDDLMQTWLVKIRQNGFKIFDLGAVRSEAEGIRRIEDTDCMLVFCSKALAEDIDAAGLLNNPKTVELLRKKYCIAILNDARSAAIPDWLRLRGDLVDLRTGLGADPKKAIQKICNMLHVLEREKIFSTESPRISGISLNVKENMMTFLFPGERLDAVHVLFAFVLDGYGWIVYEDSQNFMTDQEGKVQIDVAIMESCRKNGSFDALQYTVSTPISVRMDKKLLSQPPETLMKALFIRPRGTDNDRWPELVPIQQVLTMAFIQSPLNPDFRENEYERDIFELEDLDSLNNINDESLRLRKQQREIERLYATLRILKPEGDKIRILPRKAK